MSFVDIRVDLPSYSHTFTVKVPSSSSVSQLKQQIHQSCPGQPRPNGQRLIWRGRVLTDNENIESLWKVDPRIVHLAVHPSAWSSPPPEIPQSPPHSEVPYQPNLTSTSPSYIYPSRPSFTMATPSGFATHLASAGLLSFPMGMEYVRHQHQKALHALCPSIITPVEHSHSSQRRSEAIQALESNGWIWPAVLDEPFPEPSEGGLVYNATIVEGQSYLQLATDSENAQPTPLQQHALKVLTYTFNILYLPINNFPTSRGSQPQQIPVPPHVNQLLQQLGLPPLRPAGNNANPANPNAVLADLREIPVRALLAPLLMLLFRTLLLLYFFAPARKPIFGILILGWMVYEIWQPIRNGLRNGWGRMHDNGQHQANNGQNARQGPGAPAPNAPPPPGVRAAHAAPAGAVTLEAQAGQIFDTLANLNIEDEQRLLNPGPGGPPAEPTIGHKIVTFLSLFITTLHPAIWNRRRVALRRREGVVRTEANVRNSPPPSADNPSDSTPSSVDDEAARRREQLRVQYGLQPRWIQRYLERVVAEDWVDDSD